MLIACGSEHGFLFSRFPPHCTPAIIQVPIILSYLFKEMVLSEGVKRT